MGYLLVEWLAIGYFNLEARYFVSCNNLSNQTLRAFFIILPFFWLYSHKENILDGKNNCLQAFASSGQTMFLIFVNVDSVVCMPSRQALKEKTITHNMSMMSYLSYEVLIWGAHITLDMAKYWRIRKVFLEEENKA